MLLLIYSSLPIPGNQTILTDMAALRQQLGPGERWSGPSMTSIRPANYWHARATTGGYGTNIAPLGPCRRCRSAAAAHFFALYGTSGGMGTTNWSAAPGRAVALNARKRCGPKHTYAVATLPLLPSDIINFRPFDKLIFGCLQVLAVVWSPNTWI